MSRETRQFYDFGPFRFDPEERTLLRDGKPVPLAPKITETLFLLLQNAGHLVEKDELINRVWPDAFVEEGNLNRNIFVLRKTLGQWNGGMEYIETVPKRGYRFVLPVNQVPEGEKNANWDLELKLPSSGAYSETKEIRARARHYKLALVSACFVITTGFLLFALGRSSPKPVKFLSILPVTNDNRAKWGPLITDGSRIYTTELLPGWRRILVQVPTKAGETISISTSLKEPHVQDISPDGSELLVLADQGPGLWILPIAGGSPRRVGTFAAYDASWHPDGETIIYSTGHEISLVKKDATFNRKLLSVDGLVSHLRFSSDGQRFRFTIIDEGHQSTSLWEASADGSRLHPLLAGWNNPAKECCGSWTPDGRYFIFQSERDGKKNIWALREKSAFFKSTAPAPLQLTAGPMNFSDPISAKDGRKLFAIGVLPRAEMVRYDMRTREFVPYLSSVSAEGLDFSKSREWVTYTSYPEGELWRSNVDGSERRQLTFSPLRAFAPRWSADGKQIAFMGMLPGKEWKINIISADGGTPQQLFPGEQDEADPTWSPDGNEIAFGRGPWTKNPEVDIQVLNLNTHQVSKLVGSDGLFSPRWSPDGRYIVALRVKEPMTPMLFDFKTRKWEQLLSINMGSPSWSHQGKYLYLQDWSTPNDRMVRIRLSDRKLENIAAFESIGGLWNDYSLDWPRSR